MAGLLSIPGPNDRGSQTVLPAGGAAPATSMNQNPAPPASQVSAPQAAGGATTGEVQQQVATQPQQQPQQPQAPAPGFMPGTDPNPPFGNPALYAPMQGPVSGQVPQMKIAKMNKGILGCACERRSKPKEKAAEIYNKPTGPMKPTAAGESGLTIGVEPWTAQGADAFEGLGKYGKKPKRDTLKIKEGALGEFACGFLDHCLSIGCKPAQVVKMASEAIAAFPELSDELGGLTDEDTVRNVPLSGN